MAKNVQVVDEQGFKWVVFVGDPAWKLINKLPASTSFYALPRKSLTTGEIIDFPEPFFYSQEIPSELLTTEMKEIIVRLERIYQSVNYLRERI